MTIELHNIDCMTYMKGLPDKAFELAIVDPPYGIDINSSSGRLGHYGGKGKKWDLTLPDAEYFNQLKRVSNNQIIWGGNYFLEHLSATRCFLLWDKRQPEGISFASCEFAWTSFDENAKTFYKRPHCDKNRIHPTQKPIDLYEWLLTKYAKKGDRILDTHLGSGSSAIAAHNLGFDFVGMELDKDYYEAACNRLKQHQSQSTLFEASLPNHEQLSIL